MSGACVCVCDTSRCCALRLLITHTHAVHALTGVSPPSFPRHPLPSSSCLCVQETASADDPMSRWVTGVSLSFMSRDQGLCVSVARALVMMMTLPLVVVYCPVDCMTAREQAFRCKGRDRWALISLPSRSVFCAVVCVCICLSCLHSFSSSHSLTPAKRRRRQHEAPAVGASASTSVSMI